MDEYVCENCNREFKSDYYYDDWYGYTERANVYVTESKIVAKCPYCNHIKVLMECKSFSDAIDFSYLY